MLDFRLSAVIFTNPLFKNPAIFLKGNLSNFHQLTQFCSRTVSLASRRHFKIFHGDNF